METVRTVGHNTPTPIKSRENSAGREYTPTHKLTESTRLTYTYKGNFLFWIKAVTVNALVFSSSAVSRDAKKLLPRVTCIKLTHHITADTANQWNPNLLERPKFSHTSSSRTQTWLSQTEQNPIRKQTEIETPESK